MENQGCQKLSSARTRKKVHPDPIRRTLYAPIQPVRRGERNRTPPRLRRNAPFPPCRALRLPGLPPFPRSRVLLSRSFAPQAKLLPSLQQPGPSSLRLRRFVGSVRARG